MLSPHLNQFATPGFVPENLAIILSYLTILVLFPLDIITGSRVSFHVLYVFPLTLIALHCGRNGFVIGAVILSISVQILALLTFTDELLPIKIYSFFVIVFSNITFALIANYARTNILEAERLSSTDPLTRLSNRRAMEIAIHNETIRQKRYGGFFSLVVIDLDGFKAVNDTMGHQEGDRALGLMAAILLEHTRQSDTAFRIGGDEFVILMPNTTVEDCDRLCQGLCKTVASRMSEESFAITASIGYTTIYHSPAFTKDILITADKAMYKAKTSGKGRVVRGYC